MWKPWLKSWMHLALPACCLHCEGLVDQQEHPFCDGCSLLLQLLEPTERCRKCFKDGMVVGDSICPDCRHNPPPWRGAAAAFDYLGPAATLVKKLKYGGQPYLASGVAAFLVAQIIQLDWPLPEIVVPVPIPWLKHISRGYNQSELIATEVARLLQVPMCRALKRHHGDYSQAGLSHEQRQQLSSKRFTIRKKVAIADRRVLLIDDVFTTGSTLSCCADALFAGYPKDVYALAVCRA